MIKDAVAGKSLVVEADEPYPPLSLGWWSFDEETETRILKASGCKIRFIGKFSEDAELDIVNTENQYWMEFEYSHEEFTFPLLIEWRNVAVGGERPIVWRLDYIRSQKYWRKTLKDNQQSLSIEAWHCMDLSVIDALASWPKRDATGIAHQLIVINGGYLNAEWTEKFYRVIEEFTQERRYRAIIKLKKTKPDKVIQSPQWEFREVSKQVPNEALLAALRRISYKEYSSFRHDAEELAELRTHFATVDGSRLAIPLTMNVRDYLSQSEKKWKREVTTYWVFVTPTYITTVFGIKLPNKDINYKTLQWGWFTTFGKIGGTVFSDGKRRELKREDYYDPNFFIVREFAQFIREAAHLWRPTELLFPAPGNYMPPEKVTIYPPDLYKSKSYHLAGTSKTYSVTQYVELEDWPDQFTANQTNPHPAVKFFNETPNAADTELQIDGDYGASYKNSERAIINNETGQSLSFDCFISKSDEVSSSSIDVMKFTYRDEDMQYPLIIKRQYTIDDKYFNHDLQYKPPFWIIDHNASAEMWCVQQKSVERKHPEYGRWKRVHDFAFDAVLLWPDIRETGPTPNGVSIAIGGWFKEGWLPEVVRSKQRSESKYNQRLQGGNPKICALDELPCLSWKSVIRENRKINPDTFNLDVTKFPKNTQVIEIIKNLLRDQAYHFRNDSKATLFVCRYDKDYHRGEDLYYVPVFQYCDEDIWVQFKGINPHSHRSQKGFSPTIIRNLQVLPASKYYSEENTKISTDLIYSDEHNNQRAGSILRERVVSALEGILCDAPSHTIRCKGRPLAGKWQLFASETVAIKELE